MKSKQRMKKNIFICLSLLIVTILAIGSIYFKTVSAASRCEMKAGEIIITITSKTATSNIRYRTLGFYVTTKKQENLVSAKDSNGNTIWGPDAPPSPSKRLPLSAGKKETSENPLLGETTVKYTYDAEMVKDLMRSIVDLDRLDVLTDKTPIYFNAIFQTYQVVNGKEVILTPELTTWQGIVNNQNWANKSVFKDYFNIDVEFDAGLQDNSLYFEMGDTPPISKGALDSLKTGQKVYWDNKVTSTTSLNDTSYNLVGYYAKSNLTGKETVRKMVGDIVGGKALTTNDIINDSVTVLYGGMDIYMIYEPSMVEIVVDARDIDTNKDIKEDIYKGYHRPGDKFNEVLDNIIIVDGVTYKKTKNFYYLYINEDGNLKKINEQNENDDSPLSFTIPSAVRIPSKINVTVYYKEALAGTIPVTVKAINKDTGDEIKTLKTGSVPAGDTYNYTVSETLTQDDKTYDFAGEWKWQYKKNTSSAPIVTNTGSGTNVSFKAPSADEIKDEITVYVHYKVSDIPTDEISLRVIMVSRTGAFIEEISSEKVTKGQAISKSIQNSRTVRSIIYQYQNKWDYTYNTSSGDTTKIGSGTSASFTIPSNTKLGTVVTLKLYYDLIQEVVVPDPAPPIVLPIDSPSPQGIINGDKYLASYFHSKDGISTTENQYVTVRTREYLLGYRLVNKTGKVTFVVPITMTYTLEYFTATPEEFGGPQPVTDTVTDTQYIAVERAYSYWEIESLEYYLPSTANVYNYSLPNGGVNLSANGSFLSVPNLNTRHSSNRDDHLIPPIQVTEGINLIHEEPIRSETSDRPWIEYEDLTAYAHEMTDELLVKNDYLQFNGSTVMTDSYAEIITQTPNIGSMYHSTRMTHDKVLFIEGKVIDALKKNGVYPSNGNVTYARHPMSINASSSKFFNMNVNDVIIHTPVICDPKVYSDNDKYVQLLKPAEGAYHMVLDPDNELNDFTVRISNTLNHSYRMGYYERDFSRSFIDPDNISYIAKAKGIVRNEMKLPFDVYIDTLNDKDPKNDDFIKSGTWIVLGRETYRFYVPMWVQEGTYTAQFRSIAVNGEDKLSNTEDTRNTNLNNYVATATKTFQISGRMYGLTLYDISDEGRWRDAFRIKDSIRFKYFEGETDGTKRTSYHDDYAYYYTVGIKNQYGYQNGRYERFTFPLLNGSHPRFNNVGAIKTGYAFRFRLDTIGEMYGAGCKVRIIPTFYHVDAKGKNRQQVDIYYDEEFYNKSHYLVKIGQGIDLANLQQGTVGNTYSNIPERELRNTANVMQTTYDKIRYQYGTMYSYSDIRISSMFRTFIGTDYASHIASLPSFNKVKEQAKETELSISKYMQRWYGTYKLPTNIHVVPSGYDVKDHLRKYGIDYHEDFWLKDGYIIVNFNIESYDMNGERQLSYTNGYNYLNNGHCSMWVMEGCNTEKTDNTGANFRLYAGDVVFYYTSKKHSDDYEGRLF